MKTFAYLLLALGISSFLPEKALGQETVKIAGSTTCQLGFVELSAAPFEAATGLKLIIAGGGSGAGMKATWTGTIDVGMASRPLKPAEASEGLVATAVGWDAIAVIVNKANPIGNLTLSQLQDIHTGMITNWKEVGGFDQPIVIVTSHGGSATRAMFKEIAMNGESYSKSAVAVRTTRIEVDRVEEFPGAIGAVSTSFADQSRIRSIKVEGVEPTAAHVLNKRYPISRPLNLVTAGPPAANAKRYIDFMLGPEGQAIVGKEFIPVDSQ